MVSLTSLKITLALLFITYFLQKLNFIFILKKVVRPELDSWTGSYSPVLVINAEQTHL